MACPAGCIQCGCFDTALESLHGLTEGEMVLGCQCLGETALHWAAHNGVPKVVDLLLDKGAKIDALANGEEMTPLHIL